MENPVNVPRSKGMTFVELKEIFETVNWPETWKNINVSFVPFHILFLWLSYSLIHALGAWSSECLTPSLMNHYRPILARLLPVLRRIKLSFGNNGYETCQAQMKCGNIFPKYLPIVNCLKIYCDVFPKLLLVLFKMKLQHYKADWGMKYHALVILKIHWRLTSPNGYGRKKWYLQPAFESWMRLFALNIVIKALGKSNLFLQTTAMGK